MAWMVMFVIMQERRNYWITYNNLMLQFKPSNIFNISLYIVGYVQKCDDVVYDDTYTYVKHGGRGDYFML